MRAAVDEAPQVRLGAPGLLDATERLAVPEEEVAREDRGRAALQQQAPGLLGLLVTAQRVVRQAEPVPSPGLQRRRRGPREDAG